MASGFARLARGAYRVEVTLNAAGRPPCSAETTVRVSDGGGTSPVGAGALWGAVASGLAAVLVALWSGAAAYRRRTQRELAGSDVAISVSSLISWFGPGGVLATALAGALAGIVSTLALQQRSVLALTTSSVAISAVLGALAALSVAALATMALSLRQRVGPGGRPPRG